MLSNVPSNPFAVEGDIRSAGKGDIYVSQDEYACSTSETGTEEGKQDSGSIAGTYTGVWQSRSGVGGVALLTFVLYEVEHRLDHPRRSEHLPVISYTLL